jgi:hypothetical protein
LISSSFGLTLCENIALGCSLELNYYCFKERLASSRVFLILRDFLGLRLSVLKVHLILSTLPLEGTNIKFDLSKVPFEPDRSAAEGRLVFHF